MPFYSLLHKHRLQSETFPLLSGVFAIMPSFRSVAASRLRRPRPLRLEAGCYVIALTIPEKYPSADEGDTCEEEDGAKHEAEPVKIGDYRIIAEMSEIIEDRFFQ